MHRNPPVIDVLKEKVNIKKKELSEVESELWQEKMVVPVGYELIGAGQVVKEGALGFEPHHGNWSKVGNSVGETLNEQGDVTGITHRGWRYANPI